MFTIRKFILLFLALLWINHPAFAVPIKPDVIHKKNTSKHAVHKKKKSHTKSIKKNLVHVAKHKHSKKIIKKSIETEDNTDNVPEIDTPEIASNNYTLFQTSPQPGFVATIEQRLVEFVQKSVSSLRYSSYKFGGSRVDTTNGIYIVDCSGYVDHTLRSVFPNAYFSLVDSSGTEKPNSSHYYDFFTGLSEDSNEYWSKIEDIEQLQPGDILVFRYKNSKGKSTGGHVMVVMNKPAQEGDAYLVSVADSAPVGHSQDTRQPHVSGVGIGSLLLKVNPKTGHPAAYAWKIGSRWKKNVNIAMARPSDVTT